MPVQIDFTAASITEIKDIVVVIPGDFGKNVGVHDPDATDGQGATRDVYTFKDTGELDELGIAIGDWFFDAALSAEWLAENEAAIVVTEPTLADPFPARPFKPSVVSSATFDGANWAWIPFDDTDNVENAAFVIPLTEKTVVESEDRPYVQNLGAHK